jgi:Uma2 family endonuclease
MLVVEVADTTLEYELNIKREYYAQAGVAELWVVGIGRREVHVFSEPKLDIHRVLTADDCVVLRAAGHFEFSVAALFPSDGPAQRKR